MWQGPEGPGPGADGVVLGGGGAQGQAAAQFFASEPRAVLGSWLCCVLGCRCSCLCCGFAHGLWSQAQGCRWAAVVCCAVLRLLAVGIANNT